MIKKSLLKIGTGVLMVTATMTSCVQKDEWAIPTIQCENRFGDPTRTISQIIAMAPSNGSVMIPNGENDPEIIIEGYVVSSDENGNFFKSISIQDAPENPTAGIQIEINKTSIYKDLPVGTRIRVRANGLVVGSDRGSIKLGSVDPTYPIGRIPEVMMSKYISGVCDGNKLDVREIVPLELPNLAEAQKAKYINRLVKVKNVMFDDAELGKTFVDYINGELKDTDRKLVDILGNKTTLRNSGYFRNGKTILPEGSGEITFVVGRYNNNFQMQIRSINDIKFVNPRLSFIFKEDFQANNLNNWTAVSVTGDQTWKIGSFGSTNKNYYALMSGYANKKNNENEDWLISKEIAIPSNLNEVNLSFETDGKFNGDPLKAYITTHYTGNPATTNWVELSDAVFDTDLNNYGAKHSGAISLNNYFGQNVRIAFKYTSTSTSGTSWQVDNILIYGK